MARQMAWFSGTLFGLGPIIALTTRHWPLMSEDRLPRGTCGARMPRNNRSGARRAGAEEKSDSVKAEEGMEGLTYEILTQPYTVQLKMRLEIVKMGKSPT